MSKAWPVDDLDLDGSVEDNARRILAVRMAELYSYALIVYREEEKEALHALRIAAKRLRYTLELFADIFGDPGKQQLNRVKALQETLGEIHDHDVRIELIQDELRELALEQARELETRLSEASEQEMNAVVASALRPPPDDERRGLIAYLGREHARRRDQYQKFLSQWETFGREGMRRSLAELSTLDIPGAPSARIATKDAAE